MTIERVPSSFTSIEAIKEWLTNGCYYGRISKIFYCKFNTSNTIKIISTPYSFVSEKMKYPSLKYKSNDEIYESIMNSEGKLPDFVLPDCNGKVIMLTIQDVAEDIYLKGQQQNIFSFYVL